MCLKNETFAYKNETLVTLLLAFSIIFVLPLATSKHSIAADKSPIATTSQIESKSLGILYSVFQGKRTLWFGGENGLFGTTGVITTHYDAKNSGLSNNFVLAIYEDLKGQVWLATYGGGIFIFDPINQTFSNLTISEGLSSNIAVNFSAHKDDKLLVTTVSGVSLIDIHTFEVTDLLENYAGPEIERKAIYHVTTDSEGSVYFSQRGNTLYKYNPTDLSIQHFQEVNSDLKGRYVSTVFVDAKDNLWVATDLGLFKKRPIEKVFRHYEINDSHAPDNADKSIKRIFEDKKGKIWIASDILMEINESNQSLKLPDAMSPYLKQKYVHTLNSITENMHGELFMTSPILGLISIPSTRDAISYLTKSDNVPFGNIDASFSLDSNTSLIAADKKLYVYLDSVKEPLIFDNKLPQTKNIFPYSEAEVLITGKGKNAYKFNIKSGMFTNFSSELQGIPLEPFSTINGFIKLENNTILVGFLSGSEAGIYEGKPGESFSLLKKGQVDKLIKSSNGDIIAATRDGIFQLQEEGSWFEWQPETQRKNQVNDCLKSDSAGKTWLCTNGDGLGYLDEKTKQVKFVEDQLTGDSKYIRDIVEDPEGYFWIMTNQGVIHYTPDPSRTVTLSQRDGIIDTDFKSSAAMAYLDNKIFIAGDKLNYLVDTSQFNGYLNKRLQRETEVVLSDIYTYVGRQNLKKDLTNQINSQIGDERASISLDSDEYLLSFTFASVNYDERFQQGYEHRLVGLNNNWITSPATENTVTYTTLPSGSYIFEVKALDKKSNMEQPVTSLAINVLPPYWLTWQAYLLYIVTLIMGIYIFNSYRTKQLRLANQKLEQAVERRTKELNSSNKYIANLLEQKQSLFANVSHEIRTPLSLIVGPLQTLFTKIQDPNLKTYINMIGRNAKRLNNLVDQILELARLETANDIPTQKYSIERSLQVIVGSFLPLAESREQTLTLQIDCRGVIELLEDSLEKILSNLLSNAIKYTPEGGDIHVKAGVRDDKVIISVTDTGYGISEEKQAHIFERFTRVDIREDTQGSGIGLALVKELVKANKGSIEVISEEQNGASFIVTFPLSTSTLDTVEKEVIIQEQTLFPDNQIVEDNTSSLLKNDNEEQLTKILVVEDNADMRHFITDSLADKYYCLAAKDGQQGLELAREVIPELIVSDVMMPVMDGFELAQSLRQEELTSHIPIILLTAKNDQTSRFTGWKMDIDDYISKPFNVEELKLRVSRLLSIRQLLKKRYSKETDSSLQVESTKNHETIFDSQHDQAFYARFVEIIDMNYASESFSRKEAAEKMAIGERQLNRKLAALIDHNFSEFLRRYRLQKAKSLMLGGMQITEVSYSTGFSTPSYFSSCFKAEFGVSPKNFLIESEKA